MNELNFPISQLTIENYQTNGIFFLSQFFSKPEVENLNNEATRLWREQEHLVPQNLRVGLRTDENGKISLDRIDPVCDISKIFDDVNHHPKLMAIAETLLGGPVMVMKEKLIYKAPGTSGFGLHRDGPYVDIGGAPGNEIISCTIALDDATTENGAIEFFPATQDEALESPSSEPRDILDSAVANKPSIVAEISAGDVIVFSAMIPHRSGPNLTNQSRRTYTVNYAPAKYANCRDGYYQKRLEQQANERKGQIEGPFFIH